MSRFAPSRCSRFAPSRYSRFVCRGLLVLAGLSLALGLWGLPHAAPARAAIVPGPLSTFSPALSGKVVQAGLSGFEPDFDPIYRVIISARLHDVRPAGAALPNTMLVLSMYLENFQPDTTPILPDLLHPNQTATNLGGFMQGKAILVNQNGQIAYNGDILAEVFLDNSVHAIVDLQRRGASATAATLRLRGTFTLYKAQQNLTVRGALRATRRLSPGEQAALRVPPGQAPSWQAVLKGVAVAKPPMMGTAARANATPAPASSLAQGLVPGAKGPHKQPTAPPTQTQAQSGGLPVRVFLMGGGAVVLLVVAAILFWWPPARKPQPPPST